MKQINGEVLYGFKHNVLHDVPYRATVDTQGEITTLDVDISPELLEEAWKELKDQCKADVKRQLDWENKT